MIEISIKKRSVYRNLVSDLVRERPIRFGGKWGFRTLREVEVLPPAVDTGGEA